MKLLKLIILLVFINLNLLNAQQSRFKEGETIHVWATSGLNMRDKPDAKAKKVATIPYGAKVTVQANIGIKIPFEVEEFKGFVVKGYWLLVKYGNTEGFVFDGFLSRLPAPRKRKEGGIETYLNDNVGKVKGKFNITIWDNSGDSTRYLKANEKVSEDSIYNYSQKYRFNILYEKNDSEVGSDFSVYSTELNIYEAYFLIKTLYYDPENDKWGIDEEKGGVRMYPKDEEAGCYYWIGKNNKKEIVIEGGCGC